MLLLLAKIVTLGPASLVKEMKNVSEMVSESTVAKLLERKATIVNLLIFVTSVKKD